MKEIIKFRDNLRLVCDYIPTVRSISCGVFVGTGSAFENTGNNGISHFLEHMMFKGTTNNSAYNIVERIENIGGAINAYTSKHITAFYTICVDEHIDEAVNVLSDILINSEFKESEIIKEKSVILEEVDMCEDDGEDTCFDLIANSVFKKSPLGFTILGKKKNINNMTRDMLLDYYKQHYTSGNTVIAIAGNIKIEDAVKLVEKYFVGKFDQSKIQKYKEKEIFPQKNYVDSFKKIEQGNLAIAFKSYNYYDERVYALTILNLIFGNGMSSRLFQRIREDKALAYNIYSYISNYVNNGLLTIYLGTNSQNLEKAVELIIKEIIELKENGITEKEFLRAREQVKSNFILAQESTSSLMRNYGKYALFNNAIFNLDDYIANYDALTIENVLKTTEIFNFDNVNISYVGKKHTFDLLGKFKTEG